MANETRAGDARMDVAALYREEIFTDRKVGTLRVLQPVTPAGAADSTRATIYQGEAQLMTSMGPLPISFDIDAGRKEKLVKGLDAIGETLQHADDIARYEHERSLSAPWLEPRAA